MSNASNIPSTVYLFRITHIKNLVHILDHGLHTIHSDKADPHFLSIGDLSLIEYRKQEMRVPIEPGGSFSGYIPFYFGTRQPMLYKIATGWEEVQQHPQDDIIYVVSTIDLVEECNLQYVYTDGHARAKITNFYNDRESLEKLDWEAIHAQDWQNTAEDPDKMNRKQSECMVKDYLPLEGVERILVYSEEAYNKVRDLCKSTGNDNLTITISRKAYYDNL